MACKVLTYVPFNEIGKEKKGFSDRNASDKQTPFDVFYLSVPFGMRERVKALGAFYDAESHAWFIIRRQLIERVNYFSPKLAKSGEAFCVSENESNIIDTI